MKAFNNITTSAIHQAVNRTNVEEYINNRLVSMLKSRIVTADLGYSTKSNPLLWLIVVNSILNELDNKGIKVVAYADDVVILVSGMFPDMINDIMSNALVLFNNWTTDSGLEVNPSKTELVLFTTKTNIQSFNLPRLKNCEVPLFNNANHVKYRGLRALE